MMQQKLTALRLKPLNFLQGVSFPSPSPLRNTQHEEDRRHEERRNLLCRLPQSLHPLVAAVAHPRCGAGVRNAISQRLHQMHRTDTH